MIACEIEACLAVFPPGHDDVSHVHSDSLSAYEKKKLVGPMWSCPLEDEAKDRQFALEDVCAEYERNVSRKGGRERITRRQPSVWGRAKKSVDGVWVGLGYRAANKPPHHCRGVARPDPERKKKIGDLYTSRFAASLMFIVSNALARLDRLINDSRNNLDPMYDTPGYRAISRTVFLVFVIYEDSERCSAPSTNMALHWVLHVVEERSVNVIDEAGAGHGRKDRQDTPESCRLPDQKQCCRPGLPRRELPGFGSSVRCGITCICVQFAVQA
ncbi:hypothetical protein EDB89DRAFT_2245055 [Lactarius sanguifluus]|nr:hypothetical protein EDB89DRAFT_2245055 [Lactarius sanguifluus]